MLYQAHSFSYEIGNYQPVFPMCVFPHTHTQFSPHIFKFRPIINHISPPPSPFTPSFSLYLSHTSSLSSLYTCVAAAAMKARPNCDAACIQDVSWALLYVFITSAAPTEKWGILSTCQRAHTKSLAHLKQGCTITNVQCVCTRLTQLYLLVEYRVFST